jgi:phosphoribosyl 1,2-cyclic phosphate phosphodiesterase
MQIRLLGTGGADGIPGLFSDTRVSQYARQHGGKDVRTRCAAVVDDSLKIDLGPDTWHQMAREGLDARDWTAIIFTHSDDDHFSPRELQYALFPFNESEYVGFQVYGNGAICRRIMEAFPEWPFEVFMTRSFEPFRHADYTVTPIRALHLEDEDAHNLIFDDGTHKVLYGTDTGIWPEMTWEFLSGVKLDGLVIECTEGFFNTPYNGHLDINECIEVVTRLREMGTLSSSAPVATTHHSHNGGGIHSELEAVLNPHGIQVGYDGFVLEVE